MVGFIELFIRNFAEGSTKIAVPHVEAWYVRPECRRRGAGRLLIEHAERWAIERGFDELARDALIENTMSIVAHAALGFTEMDRCVNFYKKLKSSSS